MNEERFKNLLYALCVGVPMLIALLSLPAFAQDKCEYDFRIYQADVMGKTVYRVSECWGMWDGVPLYGHIDYDSLKKARTYRDKTREERNLIKVENDFEKAKTTARWDIIE